MKPLASDEKLVPVMIYTPTMMVHGELLAKENVRVSILLRTEGVPNYLHVHKAHVIVFGGAQPKSYSQPELFVATQSVMAFHIVPPAQEQMDYDPSETNRMMQPMDIYVGTFLLKGSLRISSKTEIGVSLEVSRISWMSIYDATISNPFLPQFAMKIPLLLVKPELVSYGMA